MQCAVPFFLNRVRKKNRENGHRAEAGDKPLKKLGWEVVSKHFMSKPLNAGFWVRVSLTRQSVTLLGRRSRHVHEVNVVVC